MASAVSSRAFSGTDRDLHSRLRTASGPPLVLGGRKPPRQSRHQTQQLIASEQSAERQETHGRTHQVGSPHTRPPPHALGSHTTTAARSLRQPWGEGSEQGSREGEAGPGVQLWVGAQSHGLRGLQAPGKPASGDQRPLLPSEMQPQSHSCH